MTPDLIFSTANLLALLAWILLALFPRRRIVVDAIVGVAVPVMLAAVYSAIVATAWSTSEGGFSSLSDVAMLFNNRWMLLAGWVHYLAFDLLIGRWEVHDARERGIPHLLVLPCLALTCLFGPAGWLLYQAVRTGPGAARAWD